MDLWSFCFWDFTEWKGSFHLSLLFCQKPQSRKQQEDVILPMQSVCWKPATFYALHLPNPGACTGSPRRVLKESSKVRGDSSARARVSFAKVHVSSILHIGISWCLTNAKMIFLSLLNSIWLSYCINLDKRKYSENVHHYKNDDCINIIHFGSKHFTSHRALQAQKYRPH